MKKDGTKNSCKLTLWPPRNLSTNLVIRGKTREARLTWDPPLVNADAVRGYQIERTSWWPGEGSTTEVLSADVKGLSFTDRRVPADRMNEYRVRAVHRTIEGVEGPWGFPSAVYGFAYTTYQRMVRELKQWARRHPDVCRLVDAGPSALRPYRMWCMVLGTDTGDHPDRPGLLLAGNIHGGEIDGGEVCLGLIGELLAGWKEGDVEIRRILQAVQIRIVPIYNPAGRSVFESGYPGRARKNLPGRRIPIPDDPLQITECWPSDPAAGIDPNRTFDVNWQWKQSDRKSDSTYAGAKPLAAPETRALVRLARALKPQISVHYHGPCGYPLLPGNWPDGTEPVDRPLHDAIGREFGRLSDPEFANSVSGGSAEPIRGMGGIAHDWFYQEFYGAHFLAEGFYGQVPNDARIPAFAGSAAVEDLVRCNKKALIWMADRVAGEGIEVTVQDEAGRPLVAEVEVEGRMDPKCSPQLTDPRHGRYRRILFSGECRLCVRSSGYQSAAVSPLKVGPGGLTKVLVRLKQKKGKRP